MKRKKWVVSKGNKELATSAAQKFGIDPIAAMIATSRGFDDIDSIGEFFDENSALGLDPLSIKDMDKAAARVNAALDSFEMICVFGDYDADGVTATALLYSYLESRGANVIRYVPDRIKEGYGLNKEAIKKLADCGVKLIVTVDNGVSCVEETKYAYSLGMQVIITDHHKTGDILPECEAVVDPHRPDCPSKFKEMSGVGVAFKLVCAIEGSDEDELLDEFAELIAIGTIGDVVSLTGENRIMVRRGVRNMTQSPGIGVASLLESSGYGGKKISSSSASFTLCPRINAAGRMGTADKALDLLLCDDAETGGYLAEEINELNILRQKTENDIFNKAVAIVESNPEISSGRILVVDDEDWHQGVIGIVAAKLTERYGKPSIVISRNGENAKGSARSIEGFSIFDAIESTSSLLTHYGGHTLAAGIGIKSADIPAFRKAINEYAAGREIPFAEINIDCKLRLSSVDKDLLGALEALEPFGSGNPQPLFGLFDVTVEEISGVLNGKHTRLIVSKNGSRLNAVYFNMPDSRFPFEVKDTVDLAVNVEENYYNGETRVSVIVRGIRPSVTDEEKVLYSIGLYNKFLFGSKITSDEAAKLIPERETQVEVFKSIKANPLKDGYCEQLCVRLGDDGEKLASYMVCVDIMREMGLIKSNDNGALYVPENPKKVNLENSEIMRKLRNIKR